MKNLFTFFAFFLTFQITSAQVDLRKETIPTGEQTALINDFLPKEKALLWKITGKDLKMTSYLYGTIHMIDKKDFFLTDATKQAVKESEMLTFEINMDDMTDISAQMGLLTKAFMADNKSLSDLLSEEEYAMVKVHFEKKGLPMFLFERIKPMFLTVLADMDLSGGGGMATGEIVSYEMELMKMGKADNKKMGGLETAEFQMSMFDSIPYEAQAKMLVDVINAGDAGNEQFEAMVQLYKDQDIQGMQTMFEGEESGLEGYEDLLLVTRNKNWIPIMGKQMQAMPTMFAVGAGHLGGKSGVIALLREAGYTVEAMK
ncbi:MAG: hypothetical protein ACI9XO_003433 [Paraglaciecola sp.]|jgi:uncharacterized protein YbaP (TraB family)